MLPRSFYFLRHGETDWNKEGRLQGHIDIPLNETGRAQARLAIPILQKYPIDRIVSSPLSRALETAQIINAVLQKPLVTDERLREKHFGLFEGKTKDEIALWQMENPTYDLTRGLSLTAPPGGESPEQLQERILAAKEHFLTDYADNVLFVAHGGIYRSLCLALGQELNQSPNAKPFHFVRHAPMAWSLVGLE